MLEIEQLPLKPTPINPAATDWLLCFDLAVMLSVYSYGVVIEWILIVTRVMPPGGATSTPVVASTPGWNGAVQKTGGGNSKGGIRVIAYVWGGD